MAYQGAGLNGADGLGLRLKLPKSIKKGVKKLGKNLKKVLRSPVTKGAIIGAAGGFIYGKVRKAQKAKAYNKRLAAANAGLDAAGRPPIVPISTPPYVAPPAATIPGIPTLPTLPPLTGGAPNDGGPSMATRQAIANKIMRGIPLSAEEMAIVRAGYLGQGMIAAAEAAYGSDAYAPGAGQPLPRVDVVAEKDNTMLYAMLGLGGLVLLSQNRRGA